MEKINFMKGLPEAPEPIVRGRLDLDVNQTWRTRGGHLVNITRCNANHSQFNCHAAVGLFADYRVDTRGIRFMMTMNREFDLVERVERVYIAGPMSGHDDLNFPAFHAAAVEYRKRGAFVVNPAEINGGADELAMVAKMTPEEYQRHWRKCMNRDICELTTCESIVMLNGWQKSKGACLEHAIAQALGLTVSYPVDTFNETAA